MSESKAEFCKAKIIELVDAVIEQENLREGNRSFDTLQWIKFYAKDLAGCKDCTEKEQAPSGSNLDE